MGSKKVVSSTFEKTTDEFMMNFPGCFVEIEIYNKLSFIAKRSIVRKK